MTFRQAKHGSLVVAATVLLLGFGSSAEALTVTPNRCAGAKTRCVMGKTHVCGVAGVRGMLKCYQTANARSSPVDPECILLAVNELRDCFRDTERRLPPCLTNGDVAAIQAKINAFTIDIVNDLDPLYPRPNSNKCTQAKMKTVADAAADTLECFENAFQKDGRVSASCLAEPPAHASYLWDRIEANGGCLTLGDLGPIQVKIDDFVADIISSLDP